MFQAGQAPADGANALISDIRMRTLAELAHFYTHLEPGKPNGAFATEFYYPMSRDPSTSGERFRAEFVRVLESGAAANLKFAAMTIACAYCVEVSRYLSCGRLEGAWLSMSEARYWCGVTLASRGLEEARAATISATRRNTSKTAADKRVEEQLAETKEEAFRLVRELCPQQLWKSRREAMFKIKDRVIAFSSVNGRQRLVDTDSGGWKTICEWLAEMPDAQKLFRNWASWGAAKRS